MNRILMAIATSVGALVCVAIGSAAAVAGGAGAASGGWAVRNLGTLAAPYNVGSEATGINASGVVIGFSMGRVAQRAFVWSNGKMRALPGFGGGTRANAIANDGDIVGDGNDAHQGHDHAILWHHGKPVDLGTLGGAVSEALAVNDNGQIVGDSTTANGQSHAFLWQNGTMTDLGSLGGTLSKPVAINDEGEVIGTSTTVSGDQHAFLWKNGTMTDLGSLPGEDSTPTAINARGEVVGYVNQSSYDPDHAVLWTTDGRRHDLGDFGSNVKQAVAIDTAGQILVSTSRPDVHAYLWTNGRSVEIGRRYTNAFALNDRGWVVGTALFRKRGPQIPFVWHAGTMTALPTLASTGPPTSAAYKINAKQWIVGRSYASAGDRAVLWTPR